MRPAVFLDRDDTLIINRTLPPPNPRPEHWVPRDLSDPARVALMPGVLEGCRALHARGFALVIFTNQGLVARGNGTVEQVHATNDRVRALLHDDDGASLIDAIYFCPYHPEGRVPEYTREHPWRKPAPGMVLAAADDLGLDLAASWLIGDAERDLQAGRSAGLPDEHLLLVGPGAPHPAFADAVACILHA